MRGGGFDVESLQGTRPVSWCVDRPPHCPGRRLNLRDPQRSSTRK